MLKMDPIEERNYTPVYQKLFFDEVKGPLESATVNQKCLMQTYSASLKLSDNAEDALKMLKINLNKCAKIRDNQDLISNQSLKHIENGDLEWESNLKNVDIKMLLNDISCCNENSETVSEENLQEFIRSISQSKQDCNSERKIRKIAKSFAPQCCSSKDKKIIKVLPPVDKLVPGIAHQDQCFTESVNESEETRCTSNPFKTAPEELNIQNLKKFGTRSGSQNQLAMGGQKRKLGTRRNFQNKFVSPMLSNNGSEELLPKNEEWSRDDIIDERLKNIEPRMVELIRSEIMDNGASVNWDDIAGLEFAKTAIQEAVVWPLLRPDIFTGLRRPPKGILLFGPPGTGKTLIGKCVASQSKSTFFSISASSLTSKWIGDGEKMVRALFTVARCHQPAVIFIDEIDSLLSQRSDTEHESSRRIKTEFLVQLDGATTDNDERVLVIGATNRPQELDEAARRRFVKRLYIPLPEIQARLQLVVRLMAPEHHNLTDENMHEISKLSDGYSGADMKNLCSEASLGPIRCIDIRMMQSIQSTEVRSVNMEDFTKAFSRVRSSVSPNDLDQYLIWNKTYGSGTTF